MAEGPERRQRQVRPGEQRPWSLQILRNAGTVTMASKSFKYLRINLAKEMRDLNNENFKLLKKETERYQKMV